MRKLFGAVAVLFVVGCGLGCGGGSSSGDPSCTVQLTGAKRNGTLGTCGVSAAGCPDTGDNDCVTVTFSDLTNNADDADAVSIIIPAAPGTYDCSSKRVSATYIDSQ